MKDQKKLSKEISDLINVVKEMNNNNPVKFIINYFVRNKGTFELKIFSKVSKTFEIGSLKDIYFFSDPTYKNLHIRLDGDNFFQFDNSYIDFVLNKSYSSVSKEVNIFLANENFYFAINFIV